MGLRGVQRLFNGAREKELGGNQEILAAGRKEMGGRVEEEIAKEDEKQKTVRAVPPWKTL